MEQKFDFEVLVKLKQKKRRKLWKRILGTMMCLVVFTTTYMLILPAITKETDTFCGVEEHTHEEACYEKTLLCLHHVHDEDCYESYSNLICTEPADDGHTHSEECSPVTETMLSCGLAEGDIHTHTENCISSEIVLNCQTEESETHTHSDACYTIVSSTVCGIEEGIAHIHDDSCYTVTTTYGCGKEEIPPSHIHTESCYENISELICTLDAAPDHEHSDECYGLELICTIEEHSHSLACYSDPTADRETAEQWEATLPALSGVYANDVLAIAKSQLGYAESERNYIVDENDVVMGYSRYGAWYHSPYGDWCAMFVSFCLHYAGVEGIPQDAFCPHWENTLLDKGIYREPSEYIPRPGDIIFFDWEADGITDHVGLVENVVDTEVFTIEGNSDNRVAQNKYTLHDGRIAGYGILPERPFHMEDNDAWAVLVEPTGVMPESSQSEQQGDREKDSLFGSVSSYSNLFASSGRLNSARVYAPLDLTPYINSVNMYDAFGNPIESGSVVTEGDLIEFKISYTITGQQLGVMNGENVTVKTDTLTYSLPKTFKMVQSGSGAIVNSVGVAVGTYEIDSTTGLITLKFADDYVKQNAKGIQIQGNVSFFSIVTKVTDSDSEEQDYEFKDDIILGVIIEEKSEVVGDLRIEKQKISVDGEEIIYEVKVTSSEGTTGPITLTDRMSAGLRFKEGIEVLNSSGRPVSGARFTASGDRSSFTMTLPEMAAGDSYTVRYRCTADIDLLGNDMTVRNTATVTGEDNHGNELKDEVTVDHTFDMLSKTGTANDDGTITWTITVNRAKADISGWVLEDLIITGSGESAYTGTVTISDSRGNVLFENVHLPLTFPEGSTDTYVITYTTSHGYADGNLIYNKAILRDDDTDITVLTGTGIGNPLTKNGTVGEVTQIDGKYVLPITWTVTIDTSIGEIPAGQVLLDTMEDWNSNEMYMTYEQLMAAYANIKAALENAGSSVSRFEAKEYRYGMGQNNTEYTYSDLTGNVNGTHSKLYEYFEVTLGKAIPKGHLITFTYETYGVFENNVLAGSSYTNQFGISDQYLVKSTVQFTAGSVKAKKMALNYYDPVAHKDTFWFWNLYDYNGTDGITRLEYEKLHDDYLAWTIELSVPLEYMGKGNIILYEDLPEGVTLKGITLPFNGNVPTLPMYQMPNGQPLQQWDLEPGNTYEWTFNIYTPQQYIDWNFSNGQQVTITIDVTKDGDLEITIPGIIFETMAQYAVLQNQLYGTTLDEWYAYLHVFTQIDEDYKWTPETEGSFVYVDAFENRFTIKNEDGDVIDIGSQSQVITKRENEDIIRKEASVGNNNIITYSIVLNAAKKDLIENSGTLKIHDELSYTSTDAQPLRVRLVPGSVKLYEIRVNPDGSYTKLEDVTPYYSYAENSTEQYGITTWIHTIDLTVPDGKSLLLEYSYNADGIKNVSHDVLNVCTIRGVGEGTLNGDSKVEIEVKEAMAQADTKGIVLYKVDADSDGIFLENARFNIYIWNEEQNKYIIVHHPDNGNTDFTTDINGMIVLDSSTMDTDQFAYNTAYYIVEVESPNGYYLGPEPYYFYIANADTLAYPSCIPEGFTGRALHSGDIIYRKNVSETTEISVEKYWMGYNGGSLTVGPNRVPEITLELWQMLEGSPNSAKLYGSYTMTPDEDGNWSLTIKNLPKATRNADGTKGTNYLYYIKEVSASGFYLHSSENNNGINSGIIKLVNRELEGYTLPETGGAGTQMYTTAGLLLMLSSAAFLMYIHKKRRREEYSSS